MVDAELEFRMILFLLTVKTFVMKVTWEFRHRKVQALLRAAIKQGLPSSSDSIQWTTRAAKWEGLVSLPRGPAPSIASLKKYLRGLDYTGR